MAANLFVGEIVGSLGKKAKNRKWRSFVVVHAPFDVTAEQFNAVIVDLDQEEYLFPGDYEDLEWNYDHSAYRLIKLFKERGVEIYSIEPADLVFMFPDKNW